MEYSLRKKTTPVPTPKELLSPQRFIGKDLKELNLINKYGVQVLAIKKILPERLNMIPKGQYVLKDGDILILLGPNHALDLLRKKEK